MSNKAKGDNFEAFVETVYQAILEAESREGKIGAVCLERKKKLQSIDGTEAEIDIYWEYEYAGITHAVAIECKDYNRNVDLPRIRDFSGKIQLLSGIKGLMISRKGFSEQAVQAASAKKIDLIVLREHTDEDWNGYIKEINIKMEFSIPSRITKISDIKMNKEWGIQQGYVSGQQFNISGLNNELILEDKNTNFRQSLFELESKDFLEDKGVGSHTWTKSFTDGWLHTPENSVKIDSISIDYVKSTPFSSEMSINFEHLVLAVIEYVNSKNIAGKHVIMKDGTRRDY